METRCKNKNTSLHTVLCSGLFGSCVKHSGRTKTEMWVFFRFGNTSTSCSSYKLVIDKKNLFKATLVTRADGPISEIEILAARRRTFRRMSSRERCILAHFYNHPLRARGYLLPKSAMEKSIFKNRKYLYATTHPGNRGVEGRQQRRRHRVCHGSTATAKGEEVQGRGG